MDPYVRTYDKCGPINMDYLYTRSIHARHRWREQIWRIGVGSGSSLIVGFNNMDSLEDFFSSM
jgi:hypothetical protein